MSHHHFDWARFGRKLTRARECAGLTLGQAAKVTGITRARLAELEAGGTNTGPGELAKFEEAYAVGWAWLLSLPPFDL